MHLRKYSVVVAFIVASIPLFSQFNTYSPYTRFGLGDLAKHGFGQNHAMGGTGIAIHEGNRINVLNPASTASLDSMSVYFDFGANGFFNQYQYANPGNPGGDPLSNTWINANFHHVAFASTMGKYMGIIAGIVPNSSIGYTVKKEYNGPGHLL